MDFNDKTLFVRGPQVRFRSGPGPVPGPGSSSGSPCSGPGPVTGSGSSPGPDAGIGPKPGPWLWPRLCCGPISGPGHRSRLGSGLQLWTQASSEWPFALAQGVALSSGVRSPTCCLQGLVWGLMAVQLPSCLPACLRGCLLVGAMGIRL